MIGQAVTCDLSLCFDWMQSGADRDILSMLRKNRSLMRLGRRSEPCARLGSCLYGLYDE